jgi:transcriptional regulator with XRE-family HTH domain
MTTTPEHIGEVIASIARRADAELFALTQEQLAAKVIKCGGSLRQEHIAHIETGVVVPRIDTLVAIASALDLDLFNINGIEDAAATVNI